VAEDEYQLAPRSQHLSGNKTFKDSFNITFVDSSRQVVDSKPEFQHPKLVVHEIELLESQTINREAPTFPADIIQLHLESSEQQLHLTSKDTKFDESAPLDDTKMSGLATSRSRDSSPMKSSSAQDAALGLFVGGTNVAALRHRSPSPAGYDSDFMGGDLDQETIDAAAAFAQPLSAKPATPERSTVTHKRSSTSKKSRKNKSIDVSAGSPKQLTAEDRRKIRELDTAAAVEDWFADPVKVPKPVKDNKPKPPAPIDKPEPHPILLRRDNKGNSKKKGKGKSKKGSISMPSDSLAPDQANKPGHPFPISSPTTKTRAANDGDVEELLQQVVEHDILHPAFVETGKESNYIDTSFYPPSQPTPSKVTPEAPRDTNGMEIVASKPAHIATLDPAQQTYTTLPARQPDNPENPLIEPTHEKPSERGSNLAGVFGWGCMKNQSSDPEHNEIIVAPAVVREAPALLPPSKEDKEDGTKSKSIDSKLSVQECTKRKEYDEQPATPIANGDLEQPQQLLTPFKPKANAQETIVAAGEPTDDQPQSETVVENDWALLASSKSKNKKLEGQKETNDMNKFLPHQTHDTIPDIERAIDGEQPDSHAVTLLESQGLKQDSADEWVPISKVEKKKAKQGKRASIIESKPAIDKKNGEGSEQA
jgi:hypothetical protein